MSIIEPKQFSENKKKYKRFFAFGCSFTKYHWPTWANILHFDIPDSQYYNFGKAGGGNSYIYAQFIAANQKYKFNEDDLIAILWSTHGREDRYLNNGWMCPGNIWTQTVYSDEYVKEYADIKGYLVRDLATFQGSKYIFQQWKCDVLNMYSVPVNYDRKYFTHEFNCDGLFSLYDELISEMKDTLHDTVSNGHGGWVSGHKYIWPGIKTKDPSNMFGDYHPNPAQYLKFLLNKGFDISEQTQKDVDTYCQELFTLNHRELIVNWCEGIYQKRHPGYSFSQQQGVLLKSLDPVEKTINKFPI
jgi:hypothetical protein